MKQGEEERRGGSCKNQQPPIRTVQASAPERLGTLMEGEKKEEGWRCVRSSIAGRKATEEAAKISNHHAQPTGGVWLAMQNAEEQLVQPTNHRGNPRQPLWRYSLTAWHSVQPPGGKGVKPTEKSGQTHRYRWMRSNSSLASTAGSASKCSRRSANKGVISLA